MSKSDGDTLESLVGLRNCLVTLCTESGFCLVREAPVLQLECSVTADRHGAYRRSCFLIKSIWNVLFRKFWCYVKETAFLKRFPCKWYIKSSVYWKFLCECFWTTLTSEIKWVVTLFFLANHMWFLGYVF